MGGDSQSDFPDEFIAWCEEVFGIEPRNNGDDQFQRISIPLGEVYTATQVSSTGKTDNYVKLDAVVPNTTEPCTIYIVFDDARAPHASWEKINGRWGKHWIMPMSDRASVIAMLSLPILRLNIAIHQHDGKRTIAGHLSGRRVL
ncbi:hypothetical protein [Octadecabacter sp. R77987]|uniref:hypothetical protein n=1 Tax=Octadecabacter sp. R77987 TaxID=3093874 RepID=UPI00366ABC89